MRGEKSRRYELAVYLLLLALSVILGLIAVNYFSNSSPIPDLLLNLTAELAGVVLLFFVVNRFFLLDEEQSVLSEIEALRKDVAFKFSPLTTESTSKSAFEFEKLLLEAREIYLLGYTMANLLSAFRIEIADSLKRGAELRVIVVDQEGISGEILSSQVDTNVFKIDSDRLYKYLNHIREESEKPQKVIVRKVDWVPSCSMIVVRRDRSSTIAKIAINSPALKLTSDKLLRDRRCLIFNQEDYPQEIDYFLGQFEELWKIGKVVN